MRSRPPRLETGPIRWWLAPGLSAEDLSERLEAIRGEVLSGRVPNQKRGRRKELYVLGAGSPEEVLVKVNRYRGASAPWRRLRRSKARRELDLALRAAAAGVPTPVPLAAGEERRGLLLERCWLVVPAIRPSLDLAARARAAPPAALERRRLAVELGRLVAALARAGIDQDDLAPNNVLLAGAGRPRLFAIDFERARPVRRLGRHRLVRMLAKFERRCGFASRTDRMRFLLALTGGDRREARRLWRAVEREMPRWFWRDVRRLERNLDTPQSSFRAFQVGGARGYRTDDLSEADLGQLLTPPSPSGTLPPRPCPRRAGPYVALPLGGRSSRALRRALAVASVLNERGLAPSPVAGWHAVRDGWLAFRTEGGPVTAGSVPPAALVRLRTILPLLESGTWRSELMGPACRASAGPAIGDSDPALTRLVALDQRRSRWHPLVQRFWIRSR